MHTLLGGHPTTTLFLLSQVGSSLRKGTAKIKQGSRGKAKRTKEQLQAFPTRELLEKFTHHGFERELVCVWLVVCRRDWGVGGVGGGFST